MTVWPLVMDRQNERSEKENFEPQQNSSKKGLCCKVGIDLLQVGIMAVVQVKKRACAGLESVRLISLGMGSQLSSVESGVSCSKSNKQISLSQQERDGSTSQTMSMQ